jgi:opacity protein-like surface antigen
MLAAVLTLVACAPAAAQTTGGQAGGWQFEFTPYLWAAGLKGDVQVGTLPLTSVDMKFTDILDVLDFALMGAFEARKGRWGFLFDAMYMKLSDSATATRTGAGPIGATLTASADVKVEQTMLAAAAAYRVSEGRSPVDVIGGLRYTKLDVSGDIGASLFGGGPLGLGATGTVARSGDKDWVDPYVGVRLQHPIADRWTLVGYADVGGFGVGSDLTWQAAAGVNYAYSKSVSLKFGYRYMSIDYDKGGIVYDVTMQGPYLAVGIRF